uniref:Uncharacterized protein n=1 Tax=Anguilla anguilla TaxID=7936 RepID=A0A0E9RFA3_ANGAN
MILFRYVSQNLQQCLTSLFYLAAMHGATLVDNEHYIFGNAREASGSKVMDKVSPRHLYFSL